MLNKILLSAIFVLCGIFFAAVSAVGGTFSRVIHDGDRTFIVDRHGERWDVTQARSHFFIVKLDTVGCYFWHGLTSRLNILPYGNRNYHTVVGGQNGES